MSKEIEGKFDLELNFVGDGRIFLNYWDSYHGNDVVVEIVDDKLIMIEYVGDDLREHKREIFFEEFIDMVKYSINKIEP